MQDSALFTIKLLNNSHSQKVIDLILPIQQLEFGVPITVQDQPDLLDIDKYYNEPGGGFWGAFQSSGQPQHLADSECELVGTIALIYAGRNAGAIRKMFVKKDFRGKQTGIAQQLIERLLDFSRTKGITDLYLGSVDRMKAAHRFYERNGFVKINGEDLPGYFPRMKNDNIFYHLPYSNECH